MAELNKSGNIKVSDKFLYIEPNDSFGNDNNTPVPLEDLCVYVDLRVEYMPQRYMTGITQDNEEVYLRVVIGNDGSKNTFLGGTKMGVTGKYGNFLTTVGYGNYTKKRISMVGTNELFGVESIDISYNSFMVPEVTIKFVDIKGAALHGAEELAHNSSGVYDRGVEENIENNYSRKFLSSFFTVPYPRFEMIVKGFYGKPVHYDLTCADFKSTFDSQTGNYTAVAKMVGYSFALISDIQICSLLAAPYSSFVGASYWKTKQNDGTFLIDGAPMPKLQEIVATWHNKMEEINKIQEKKGSDIQGEMQTLNNNLTSFQSGMDKVNLYMNYLLGVSNSTNTRREESRTYYDEINKVIVVISLREEQNIDKNTVIKNSLTGENIYKKNWGDDVKRKSYINDLRNVLSDGYFAWKKIEEWEFYHCKGQKNNQERFNFLLDKINGKNIDGSSKDNIITLYNELYADMKETSEMFVYMMSFKDLIQKLTYDIENTFVEYSTKQHVVEEEINQELSNVLGFKPTLENISKICFAHLETFLYMFERVKQCELSKNDITIVKGKHYNNLFKVFPEYREYATYNGVKKIEEGYIGKLDLFKDKTEIQFVKGLINGIKDGVINDEVLPIGVQRNNLEFYHISPIDVIKRVNPFSKCQNGILTDDFMKGRLSELFVLGLQRYGQNFIPKNMDIVKEMGSLDAQNYYALYPNGYENIVKHVIEKKWSKLFVKQFSQGILNSNINNDFYKTVNQNSSLLNFSKVLNVDVGNLMYNDSECNLLNIIDDGSLDGTKFISWSEGIGNGNSYGEYTINSNGGWSLNELESCFRFKHHINNLTAYIVPKAIDRNTVDKIPHTTLAKSIIKNYSPSRNIFNDYQYKEKGVVKYHLQRFSYSNDKMINANFNENRALKYEYVNENLNKEVDFQVVACNRDMNANTHTILTIPGYKYVSGKETIEINNGTLFTQEIYYNEKDKYVRAALFLGTFMWGREYGGSVEDMPLEIWESNSDKRKQEIRIHANYNIRSFDKLVSRTFNIGEYSLVNNDFQYIESVPLFYVLKIGALLYLYIQNNKKIYNFTKSEYLINLKTVYKHKLINYFKKWVDKTYSKWDDVFLRTNNITDKNNELYYLTLTSNGDYERLYIRLFRQDHWVVNEMTKQLFQLVVLYKYNPIMLESTASKSKEVIEQVLNYQFNYNRQKISQLEYQSPNPCIALTSLLESYMDGFYDTLSNLYGTKISNTVNANLKLSSNDEKLEFGIYRYLRQIWNRWLVSEKNDYYDWLMDKVFDEDNGRIHFIDSSYNKIGNVVSINIAKFCELIESCKEQKDMPFLTFLSYFYKDNNCALYNIQNFYNNQNGENVKRIFDPIPFTNIEFENIKTYSDLIVMFSYHPAESEEDSFNINEELISKLPEHLRTLVGDNYRVPAIGVSYGAQNQNYFLDIDVSMQAPNVTDQSLQALFQIADENSKKAATDGRVRVRSFGQDQWEVFSNHAYECSVKMMGCAWIQPLMYFQLLNVPFFRGAYIIQKVRHNIQAGQMYTTFSGVKISQKSFKVMSNTQLLMSKNMINSNYDLSESFKVNTFNDCPYVFYNPYGEDDLSDTRHQCDFETFMEHKTTITNFDNTESIVLSNYELFAITFAKTARLLMDKQEKVFIQMLVVLFYNFYKRFRDDYVGNINNLTTNFLETYKNIIYNAYVVTSFNDTKTFVENEKQLVQTTMSFIKLMFNNPQQWTSTWAKNIPFINCVDGLVNKFDNIVGSTIHVYGMGAYQFVKGFYGDISFYFGDNSEPNETSVLTIKNVIDAFNKTLSHIDIMKGYSLQIKKEYHDENISKALLELNKISSSNEIYGGIFDMILQTYGDFLRSLSWIVKDENASSNMWDYIYIELTNGDEFDVKVGYVKNNDDILIETIVSYDTLNHYFYASLMKKYSIERTLLSGKFTKINNDFKTQCKNFNSLNSEANWKERVLDFFSTNEITSNLRIESCDEGIKNKTKFNDSDMEGTISKKQLNEIINKYENFQFNGYSGDTHTLEPNLLEQLLYSDVNTINDDMELFLMRNGFTEVNNPHGDSQMAYRMEKLGQYAKNNIVGSSGACAKYVRLALENVLKLKTDGRPNSASRYAQILSFWGFTLVYEGWTSQFKGEYLNGDIIVTAGKDLQEKDSDGKLINPTTLGDGRVVSANRHPRIGHIQIYYNGKWYADKEFPNANVYSSRQEDRPSLLFRGVGEINNSVKIGLNEKNGKMYWGDEFIYEKNNGGVNWYPSDSVLNKIKEFEGWHEGWKLCPAGYPTTGWGFIQTPDLLKKYPNGMTKNEANEYFKNVAVPERVKQLKNIMKNMMFYNNFQMDALFDLLYNIGKSVFRDKSPNMMASLKARNVQGVIRNMDHGLKSGLKGLIKRREYDRDLFKTNLND